MDGSRLLNLINILVDHVSQMPAGSPVRGPFLDMLLQLVMTALSNPALQAALIAAIMKRLGVTA